MPHDLTMTGYYGTDLALVHDRGFGFHAERTAPGVLALLDGVRRRGGVVHEIGCGSGALTHHLVAAGHRVIASDASPAFLELVRRELPDVDARRIRLPDDPLPPADAVVGIGHVLNYLPDADAVRRALTVLAASVRPGGLLLVDLCDLAFAVRETRPPYARVTDDWAIVTRFSSPRPDRFVRDITTFLREDDGRWRRSDERHDTVLLETAAVPGWLEGTGVRARIRPAFGAEELPPGLVVLAGEKAG
ncbi:MAG: class I SAM-dependent methyltransferase [Kineosporiaceae bacterium]